MEDPCSGNILVMKKEPVKPVFLLIAESLRKDILFGHLDPGMVLNEVQTATKFNTSRAPVRESFRILEGEGLIIRNNPVGYKVKDFDLSEFIERKTLLRIIEKEMLLRAIPLYTELDLCQMERMVDEISASENLEKLIENLIKFNESILQPAGWLYAINLVRQILFRSVPYYREIAKKYMNNGMAMNSHRSFIRLCREGKTLDAIDCWISRYDKSGLEVFAKFTDKTGGTKPLH
jgi:DNA-binding GntR family transcriptional regulator